MRRILLILISVGVFGSVGANAQRNKKNEYQILSIAFYNFENLFDTLDTPNKIDEEFTPDGGKKYNGEIYFDKLGKIAHVLSKIGTDKTPDGPALIGTAEIENISVLNDLVKQPAIADRNYQPILLEGPDKRGIDPALLYNPKYFQPIKSRGLWVPLFEDEEKTDTIHTRNILYVKGILMNELVHIFVNHWPSRRGGEERSAPLRNAAATVCKTVVDSIIDADDEAKIIVMGDFNDDPHSPSIKNVLLAQKSLEKLKIGDLYNPFTDYYVKGIGTLAWRDSWNLFDQIIMSQQFTEKEQSGFFFSSSEVYNKPYLTQKTGNFKGYPFRSFIGNNYTGGYSDHFPVLAYFVKKISK